MSDLLLLLAALCLPFVIADAAVLIWPASREGCRRLTPREAAYMADCCRRRLRLIAWTAAGIGGGAVAGALLGLPLTGLGLAVLGPAYGCLVYLRHPVRALS